MWGSIAGIATSTLQSSAVKTAASAVTGRTLQFFGAAKGSEIENAKLTLQAEIKARGNITLELLRLSLPDKLELAVLILERDVPKLESFLTRHPQLLTANRIPAQDIAKAMIKYKSKLIGDSLCGEPVPDTGFQVLQYLFNVRTNSNELLHDIVRWFSGQESLDLSHLSAPIKRLFNLIKTRYGLSNDFELFTTFNHNKIHFYPYMEFTNNEFPTEMNDRLFFGSTFERCSFFPGCNFSNTDLRYVKFNFCVCNHANFIKVNLQGSELSNSFFKEAKFFNTSLEQSRIAHCDFESAIFKKAEEHMAAAPTSFLDASIEHSNFKSATFTEVLVGRSDPDQTAEERPVGIITHSSFISAHFLEMNFSTVSLSGNEFNESEISSCILGKSQRILQKHVKAQ